MKRFIGFVKKEFYHIFRDKRSMFILFGMPIAQILLFGFAITNEINNVEIGILDKSKDHETRKIIDKINASEYFTIKNVVDNENAIESVFKKGEVKAFLVFGAMCYQPVVVLKRVLTVDADFFLVTQFTLRHFKELDHVFCAIFKSASFLYRRPATTAHVDLGTC